MNELFLSVIMGVHNVEASLGRAVDSILAQTYTGYEFIICDDGSTDKTWEILQEYAARDARIHLLKNEQNRGLAYSLNRCLRLARGSVIARMDGDDASLPDRFEKQLQALSDHLEISFVGCNVNLWQNGHPVGKLVLPQFPNVKDFYITQPYIHPTLMFRYNALSDAHGYSESNKQVLCEDYDLLLRLYALGYQGMNLQEPLFNYTMSNSIKGTRKMTHRWNETVTRFHCFSQLHLLPAALPYVVKPLLTGLLPTPLLKRLKTNLRQINRDK